MRYLALTKQDRESMLKAIGVTSVDDFFEFWTKLQRLIKRHN